MRVIQERLLNGIDRYYFKDLFSLDLCIKGNFMDVAKKLSDEFVQ